MTARRILATVALGLFLGSPGPAKAQFRFTTIDVPGSTGTAVNATSPHAIAGQFDDADGNTHGFVLSNGAYTTVDVPHAAFTSVNGINPCGWDLLQSGDRPSMKGRLIQVVGPSVDPAAELRPWTTSPASAA